MHAPQATAQPVPVPHVSRHGIVVKAPAQDVSAKFPARATSAGAPSMPLRGSGRVTSFKLPRKVEPVVLASSVAGSSTELEPGLPTLSVAPFKPPRKVKKAST